MVVDGRFEFVGSDERRANEAIKGAAKSRKAPVSISFASGDREAATVHIEAGPLPSSVAVHPAGVFLAIADNSDESQVSRGENAGRTLQHVAVLRNLIRIGVVDETAAFSRQFVQLLLLHLAVFTPFIRKGMDNQKAWEKKFYAEAQALRNG